MRTQTQKNKKKLEGCATR